MLPAYARHRPSWGPSFMTLAFCMQPYSATREVLPGAWQAELARLAAEGGDAAAGAPPEGQAAAVAGAGAAAPSPAAPPGTGHADAAGAPAGTANVLTELQQKVSSSTHATRKASWLASAEQQNGRAEVCTRQLHLRNRCQVRNDRRVRWADLAGRGVTSGHQPAAGAGLAPARGGGGGSAAPRAGATREHCCRSGGHAPDPAAAVDIARQADRLPLLGLDTVMSGSNIDT